MSGASTANGARLIARNNNTRDRAASGLIDKNNESASEIASAASPAIMNP
jgi:hypothetical protein